MSVINSELQQVPEGYKQTEVGVIPDDWEASTIGKNTRWSSGGTPSRKRDDYWEGSIPWISGSTLKVLEISTSDQFLTEEGIAAGSNMAPVDSTLLLVRGSALHKYIRAGLVTAPVSFNQDVKSLVPVGSVLPKYLTYFIKGMEIDLLKLVSSAGNSAGVLDTELVKNFRFLKPSFAEQTAIANALSDVDALITSLEKLIAKKRAIKTAAMQQLLTGKKRLPPFDQTHTGYKQTELGKIPEDWELRPLSDFLKYEQPTPYLVMDTKYTDNGDVPVLTAGKTFILGYTYEKFGVFNSLPAIIFDDFTTATKFVDFPFKAKSSAMKMLLPRTNNVNLHYIFSLMQLIVFPLGDHKRHWIGEYQHLNMAVPSESEEQKAISNALSNMTNEVGLLEKRLNKTQQIKQGMMQELLTGRTRLV